MLEIRFHGRGGQGSVTAATLLATAGFKDGKFTQAFPMFGVERRGAPVQAFTRISNEFIRRRSAVYQPDILVVLDSTLFEIVNIAEGLKPNGIIIINSGEPPEKFKIPHAQVFTADATSLALKILKADIVNTAMLGAFSAFTEIVGKKSICQAIREYFPKEVAEKNVTLVENTYEKAKKDD